MAKSKATAEVVEYILMNYMKMSRGQIAKHFGFSIAVCHGVYRKYNLVVPKSVIEEFRIKVLTGRTNFAFEEDDFIKQNYLTMPIKTIGHKLNRSGCGIAGRMRNLNLVVPKEIIQQRKLDSNFKAGHVPDNKGKKQTEYMTAEAIEKTKHTRFQKGHVPGNALPDGAESQRLDKRTSRTYTMIKVPAIKKLKYKQIHIWEIHHKMKLPAKHNITFKDGDTNNFNIENLECISHSELMLRNSIQRYPLELKQQMFKIGKLKRIITKKEKK